ncbi:hypothetical protein FW774_04785 (plasmid) [Pedobacter sp. BS3]|uniref:alpha-2-macroglobulin family protein n=1 Tax=Pedobacter sp. BS3 TaxID=2567937 RepID=UPI0011EC5A4E|nr:alpha-2-macroglobulin family protein [Pedobacter sp. BS3]TZF86366.1 hypothetical protein FW774_04785 [Pedobacter sp. BS3]
MTASSFRQLLLVGIILVIAGSTSIAQTQSQNFYTRSFKLIDSLADEGLPKDALTHIEQINARARAEGNSAMLVKSVIYRMIFQSYLEEDALVKIITAMQQDIAKAGQPEKSILQSLLAETYWNYYQQNSWKIMQRTGVEEQSALSPDIRTWPAATLVNEVLKQYRGSLADAGMLKKTPVSVLDSVLKGDKATRKYRPTLYDLLAQRAIDVLMDARTTLPVAEDAFTVNHAVWLGNITDFIKQPVPQTDSLSLIAVTVKLFQDILAFHNNDADKAALADADLKRLQFIYRKSDLENKDTLYLNRLKQLETLSRNSEVYSDVLFQEAQFYKQKGDQYKTEKSDRNRLGYVEAVNVARRAITAYPKSTGAVNARQLIKVVQKEQITAKTEDVNLPGKPMRLFIQYQNAGMLFLYLYKIPVNASDTYNTYGLYGGEKSYTEFLQNHQALRTWRIILPAQTDYQQHNWMDKIDALDAGQYVLFVSSSDSLLQKKQPVYASLITVSNLAVSNRTVNDNMEFTVTDRTVGKPLQNARIRLYTVKNNEEKTINRLVTDTEGYASCPWNTEIRRGLAILNKDTLVFNVNGGYSSHSSKPSRRIVLFTDRGIYRPAQTVYFKGLYLRVENNKNSIVTNEKVTVTFKDVNREKLAELLLQTNEYGTFQGSFAIPQGKLNGAMVLSAKYGSVNVQVEEYKRPSFEVTFDKPDQRYKLNDSITVTGRSVALAGYAVSQAGVKYTVTRAGFPVGRWYYAPVSTRQIAHGTIKTDDNGNFKIRFLAAADDMKHNYSYTVNVDVTDASGETHSNSTRVNAGQHDILLQAEVPGKIQSRDSIQVQVTNLNQTPVAATADVKVVKLKEPGRMIRSDLFDKGELQYAFSKKQYLEYFPFDAYQGDDQPENWPDGNVVLTRQLKLANGRESLALDAGKLESGYYRVYIKATTHVGDTASTVKVFAVTSGGETLIETPDDWLIAEQESISPGENAVFKVAAPFSNGYVLYEIYRQDRVIKRQWLPVSRKQTKISIPVTADFDNSFAVQFSMMQQNRLYRSLRTIQVDDKSKSLDVKLLTFRNKLQPGEQEQWKIQVSNKKGEKELAEMVATLYDASLDAFKPLNWQTNFTRTASYSKFSWHSYYNTVSVTNPIWFLQHYSYLNPQKHNYEQIDLLGYSYYGGYNSLYRNYMNRVRWNREHKERIAALKLKLDSLAKTYKGVFGMVTDARTGEGLPRVVIKLKDISITTDADGMYKFHAATGDMITISFVGYEPQTIRIPGAGRLDIKLMPLSSGLDEVVVVGYGEQKRQDLTGAVASTDYVGAAPKVTIRGSATVTDNNTHDFASVAIYDKANGTAIINGRAVQIPKEYPYLALIEPRKNFNETAFFYPQLHTDENGQIVIDFTIPQSLTRWKLMAFAHTKDLKTGSLTQTLITQKQLAVSANAPRFFREGDTIIFAAKLNNISGSRLSSQVLLSLKDAFTGQPLNIISATDRAAKTVTLANGGSEALKWQLVIPQGIQAITYRLQAQSGSYADGEENTIPVLPNAMLVTETLPLNLRDNQTKTFTFDKLLQSGQSATLRQQSLTVEFTPNPVWYAVQALPYLMEYPYECAEQTFSRFYANSFATGIINSSPKIKQVFEQWQQDKNGQSLLSNLEKNQELKTILLEETPWVRDAAGETGRKKRIAILFDLNRMRYELKNNFDKLKKMQNSDGSFPWFTGMSADRYITQHIVLGIGQLKHLNLIDNKTYPEVDALLKKAITWLDGKMVEDYKHILSKKDQHFTYLPLHYLYARSYGKQENASADFQKAYSFFLKQTATDWKTMSPYQQAQAALVLQRAGNTTEALKIIRTLKQRAQQSEELGMYWPENKAGWWWYQSPIETQAILIEAFDEVAHDTQAVEEMKVWLLKNKQTNDWETTKATAAACYALLMRGYNLLDESAQPQITLGGQALPVSDSPAEAGTGYTKTVISGNAVKPAMGNIRVTNTNKGIAWGAVYWQYFENLDKVTSSATAVKIKKQLFLQKQTSAGKVLAALDNNTMLAVGDLIKVRIEISTDRDMEYIHLKDMRSAGFEPVNVISRYKYQDGLGYYESTKDASTNFFISYLRKGVYVFEYPLRVTHAGNFSNGITSLQCMYAPEFSTYWQGTRVTVK